MENLEAKYYNAIKECQELLAQWIVPDSTISDSGVLSNLLGVLDSAELVIMMRESKSVNEKYWIDSPNVARTKYYAQKKIFELEYRNGCIYHYYDFPAELWLQSYNCISIGSFLHRRVKGNYRYCKQ